MPRHRTRFYYTRGSDGCDDTFDVFTPDSNYVVSVRFWVKRAWAEKEAKKIVRLLNEHREPVWVTSGEAVV